jgi:mRNA-degrading endonuclease YafQ of YafQ-DinJ toxin-antitoxin module
MELISTKHFQKRVKKLIENKKHLKSKIDACLLDFAEKGKQSVFYRHRMQGDKKGLEELQIGGDLRIIIKILWKADMAYLLDIGTHSQLKI